MTSITYTIQRNFKSPLILAGGLELSGLGKPDTNWPVNVEAARVPLTTLTVSDLALSDLDFCSLPAEALQLKVATHARQEVGSDLQTEERDFTLPNQVADLPDPCPSKSSSEVVNIPHPIPPASAVSVQDAMSLYEAVFASDGIGEMINGIEEHFLADAEDLLIRVLSKFRTKLESHLKDLLVPIIKSGSDSPIDNIDFPLPGQVPSSDDIKFNGSPANPPVGPPPTLMGLPSEPAISDLPGGPTQTGPVSPIKLPESVKELVSDVLLNGTNLTVKRGEEWPPLEDLLINNIRGELKERLKSRIKEHILSEIGASKDLSAISTETVLNSLVEVVFSEHGEQVAPLYSRGLTKISHDLLCNVGTRFCPIKCKNGMLAICKSCACASGLWSQKDYPVASQAKMHVVASADYESHDSIGGASLPSGVCKLIDAPAAWRTQMDLFYDSVRKSDSLDGCDHIKFNLPSGRTIVGVERSRRLSYAIPLIKRVTLCDDFHLVIGNELVEQANFLDFVLGDNPILRQPGVNQVTVVLRDPSMSDEVYFDNPYGHPFTGGLNWVDFARWLDPGSDVDVVGRAHLEHLKKRAEEEGLIPSDIVDATRRYSELSTYEFGAPLTVTFCATCGELTQAFVEQPNSRNSFTLWFSYEVKEKRDQLFYEDAQTLTCENLESLLESVKFSGEESRRLRLILKQMFVNSREIARSAKSFTDLRMCFWLNPSPHSMEFVFASVSNGGFVTPAVKASLLGYWDSVCRCRFTDSALMPSGRSIEIRGASDKASLEDVRRTLGWAVRCEKEKIERRMDTGNFTGSARQGLGPGEDDGDSISDGVEQAAAPGESERARGDWSLWRCKFFGRCSWNRGRED